jgi:pre-mRNA-splicing helicase BRR2
VNELISFYQAIAQSMFRWWSHRFGTLLGKSVGRLTGDSVMDLKIIDGADIIIATSTQWDSLSRRWKQRKQVQNVALFLADELHLLGGSEGPILEIVLSRARYVASQLERKVRIVALSSSLANARDVGDWLGAPTPCIFSFSPDVRSVPVDVHIFGFEANHPASRLLAMAKPTYNAVAAHASCDKPAIVFVPSRLQSQLTAIDIITSAAAVGQPTRFLYDSVAMTTAVQTVQDPSLAETLIHGVAFFHAGLCPSDYALVETLFREHVIGVLVGTYEACWSIPALGNLVVVMDTVYYEAKEHRSVDCSIADVLQMIGCASNPVGNHPCKSLVLCQAPKKDVLKKLIHDSLPVESHLDQVLHDHICAEIVSRTIENKQDAVDYLTWTFFYRRLTQNPNYYNLQGTTRQHVSDHLSEMIETVVHDLEESKCLAVEDDFDLSPLNIGTIASYYYIQYTTIELFASSVTEKTKIKGLLEILSSASEYASLPIRVSEENALSNIAKHLPQALPEGMKFDDPAIKALILLQTHFTRIPLPSDFMTDLRTILTSIIKLTQAIVDVISSQGWLRPALAAMEVSQMVVQGMWSKDSVLLQMPHVSNDIVARCKAATPPVETIFDVLELDDDVREDLFRLSPEKMSDVAVFCNAYPNVELTYSLPELTQNNSNSSTSEGGSYSVAAGETVKLEVLLKREAEDDDENNEPSSASSRVVCPRFVAEKIENWWVVLGDNRANVMMSIKRVALDRQSKVRPPILKNYTAAAAVSVGMHPDSCGLSH